MQLVLVEDDVAAQLLTEAQCRLGLSGAPGFRGITATARTLKDAAWILAMLEQQQDREGVAVVLDLHLPDSHGVQTALSLLEQFPEAHIIAHSCDDRALARLQQNGVTVVSKAQPDLLTSTLSELLQIESAA